MRSWGIIAYSMRDAEYEFCVSTSGRGWLALEYVPILLVYGLLLAATFSGKLTHSSPAVRALMAVGAVAFSYLGYLSLRASSNRKLVLRLSPNGIEEGNFGFGLIPWTAILGGRAVTENRRGLLCEILYLRVADWRPYLDRVSTIHRLGLPLLALRQKLIPLELTYLDAAMDDLIQIIEEFQPDFRVG